MPARLSSRRSTWANSKPGSVKPVVSSWDASALRPSRPRHRTRWAWTVWALRHAWSFRHCWRQITLLEQQIATADAELEGRVAALASHVLSVPGARGLLAATLLAELGDVQRFDRVEQVVAFAGLDASVFESGDFHGTRQHISKRGSPHLRRALYLAAFNAIKTDSELAAYFQRKQAEGKPFRVALVATSRKLLARVYVVLRDARPYRLPSSALSSTDHALPSP